MSSVILVPSDQKPSRELSARVRRSSSAIMDAGQGFVDALPIYTIMPNASPQYVVGIKLSSELLQHLQSKGTAGMTISFGSQNIISVGNEQFSFRAPPEEHGVTDCYHQVDEGEEGTFTKVGVVKRKIFVTQKLREEDRKRVKTATETHEKERLSHKSVLIDSTGQLISKDGKRKAPSSITKPPPTVIKRNRTETTQPRPQLASLSSMASKHATAASSKLSSPKRVPLRTQIVQLLALEALPHEQIEAKCSTASKTALASTLQQVAKMKDGLYHLKKEMYREVDTNWPSFTPEDKAKVLERKALAKQPEQEKKKEEEAAEDIPAPEPIALEAKATGTRYPSPLPRSLAAAGKERAKPEEKVIPARLAPPPSSSSSSSSSAKMEKEKEKERELARERERAKEKEKEKELARERERAKEEERERERLKEREKERERLLREKHERSPKDPSPAHSSASSSASSSPSGSPAALVVPGSSPNKAKEEASAPRNGEHKRKNARTEPPREGTTSLSLPSRDNNGAWKGPSISLSEYKKRRAEWEKNYKEYCELHRKLNENAQFFQNLGGQLKKASSSEKTKIVHQISTDYQKRISRVRQMKLRFSFLHGEIKREKAALLALNPS